MVKIVTEFQPAGDQPEAIADIVSHFEKSHKHHVLLGATGSGKTFTMANVIQRLGLPTLIIAPNKTLAAQLYTEFKNLFPNDAVGFFISYYDYYQPEAYVPSSDTYIAKDSSINEDIDKMRHESTRMLFEDKQSIIIASVSCIYGLGSPGDYGKLMVHLAEGQKIARDELLRQLVDIQYARNDWQLSRGHFRVRGDVIDILPSHSKDEAIRVELFGSEIDTISLIDALTGETRQKLPDISIYPNSHYVTLQQSKKGIINGILSDLGERLRELKAENKLVEFQRLEQRTMQDVETFDQLGFCPGIENYSRYLTGQNPGEPPPTLLDYFPENFLTIIDESHITVPQIRAMYRGDRSRKSTLVDFGFRLPSALDNRPLNHQEFLEKTDKILYVSATPSDDNLEAAEGRLSEQVIRPTGLIDPEIQVRPAGHQVDDLLAEMRQAIKGGGRVLITTLTKKMAEDLTDYYRGLKIKIRYLHSDIDSIERTQLLRELRLGMFDVLVGINLLREGLDLPEVKLVAVMDADKEGFLRSRSSLIQITGRAARNAEAKVIFYADRVTDSMRQAMDETARRRAKQMAHNEEHGITPKTVIKPIPMEIRALYGLLDDDGKTDLKSKMARFKNIKDLEKQIQKKQQAMKKASGNLEFEKAAELRDEIKELKSFLLTYGEG